MSRSILQWIHNFDLFLFDFDGLLVNTEHLHFQAYVNVFAKRGYHLKWSFQTFTRIAHIGGSSLQEAICGEFPDLGAIGWEEIYLEKRREYLQLITRGKLELMPGVKPLLQQLEKENIRRCVVTHAMRDQVNLITPFLSILKTIPYWFTREEFGKGKPDPEGYLRAIQLLGKKGDRIIGFEDSVRGLKALAATPALPVLICEPHYPHLNTILQEHKGAKHFPSLDLIHSLP